MAFHYDMTRRGSCGLYEYLYRCIRADIERGAVDPGDRLPSKRALAADAGVSVITVEKAYAQLAAEGYIQSRQRRGYFVSRLPGAARHASIVRSVADHDLVRVAHAGSGARVGSTAPTVPSVAASSASSAADPASSLVADFSWPVSNPGVASGLWSKALKATLAQESDRELYAPQPSQGSLRLRRAIAAHLSAVRGMDVDPGCIVIGAGAQILYGQVAQLVAPLGEVGTGGNRGAAAPWGGVRRGTAGRQATARGAGAARHPARDGEPRPVIAVENPGYPRLSSIYASYGFDVRHVPLDAGGIDIDALDASGAGIVHIMPSHQFPTGRVTSVTRRYELLGWLAGGSERYLVEDDYDNEFRMAGRPIPSLASIDVLGRVIYIGTFSKSLGSALRLAYMVLPPVLAARYDAALGFYSSTVGVVDQICLARLLESGDYARHVNRYRTQRRQVRDALLAALAASPAAPRLSVEEADSGLHFVLAVRTGATEAQIARAGLRHGVRLAPMSRYATADDGAPWDDAAGYAGVGASVPLPGYADTMPRFVMQYDGLSPEAVPRCSAALAAAVLETAR